MKMYQYPVVNAESLECMNAMGQYVFEITSACPIFNQAGIVGQEGGLAFCGGLGEPGFSPVITCQNISGSYNAVFGDSIAGGGLSCGSDQSVIYPIISISPDLPADCIVESLIINGSNQC